MAEQEAGRELDAAVAEEVMGLTVVADDWPCSHPNMINQWCEYRAHQYVDDDGDEQDYVYLPEGTFYSGPWPPSPETGYSDVKVVPRYSTDIAAAMDVWTHFRYVAAGGPQAEGPEDEYWAHVFCGSYDEFAVAPTLPEAICRAALKAVRATPTPEAESE